jgi:predicted outer membrane protein
MRLLTTTAATVVALSIGLGSATAATSAGTIDRAFVTAATQSNLSEIAAGELALKKSASPKVKTLGKQFIDDHTKANAKLASIARAQGLAVPTSPNMMQKKTAAALKELSGSQFDTMWLKTQETGHEQTVALFKSEISSGTDPALVHFATTALPVVEGHLNKLTLAATTPAEPKSPT